MPPATELFVLLEHDTRRPPPPAGPPRPHEVHWDFLVTQPGIDGFATWRLHDNPLTTTEPIPAQRIPDHRPAFRDYEGEISRNRGRVRRLDRGPASIIATENDELTAELHGTHLAGRIRITRQDDQLRFVGAHTRQ